MGEGNMHLHGFAFSAPQLGAALDDDCFDYDVAIVGLDERGLLMALEFHEAGVRVLAVDASADRLVSIGAGLVDLPKRGRERLSSAIADERFQLTADPSALSRARAVMVCVSTPVDNYFVPDLTALRDVCATVVEHAASGQVLMLTSTTYVGCTEELLAKPLLRQGFRIGEDIFVAFSAELLGTAGETVADEEVLPRVVGGATLACEARAVDTLSGCAKSLRRAATLELAETTKLLESTFRAVDG